MAMEAIRQVTMAAHLQLQNDKEEPAAQQARWRETMANEQHRRPRRQTCSTTNALAACGREMVNDIDNIEVP